ncbi:hypothetical protein L1987_33264 [Smallanthus sonchifolius]|uniref:Uncharacterized protein n=1 Tax=Smallanthus sonchifolius TaxID=185202 RepID=A0ACB9HRD3_9ASTR|nr:hypothetical protein L1987_33264 [Smallanthus sonchifolius]
MDDVTNSQRQAGWQDPPSSFSTAIGDCRLETRPPLSVSRDSTSLGNLRVNLLSPFRHLSTFVRIGSNAILAVDCNISILEA